LRAGDRYEPLETARWLTKQPNEQSNARTSKRDVEDADPDAESTSGPRQTARRSRWGFRIY
jgi:hypothetical protein